MGIARRIASHVSTRSRERKFQRFMRMCQPTSKTRVLDVGFCGREYSSGDNYIEKHYPWPHQLTALGIDDPVQCRRNYPQVTFVRYDGARFPFESHSFDVAWSNAVLEHVGNTGRQCMFIRELVRVAARAWITTPSRAFPVDPHTLIPLAHWLPRRLRDLIYARSGHVYATGDRLNLLYRRDLERLLESAGVIDYAILTNRFMLWPMDYVVVVGMSSGARPCLVQGGGERIPRQPRQDMPLPEDSTHVG